MGTSVVLFQASTRVASTGNFRGTPSGGSASSVVTCTAPVAADLRRNGSKKKVIPAPNGNSPRKAPMQPAKSFLKKSRRPGPEHPFAPLFILNASLDVTRL